MYYDEFDNIEMFTKLGFEIPKGHKGMVSCPQHQDKHPSMSINLTTGLFNCFSCGFHGRIDKLYKEKTGQFYKKSDYCTPTDLEIYFKRKEKPKIVVTKDTTFTATFQKYDPLMLEKWLKYRGISLSVADRAKAFYGSAKINYLDDSGKERSYTVHDRIIFPVYDDQGKLKSLEMRFPFFGTESKAFKESIRKVLYPKGSSTNLLYDSKNLDKSKKLYVLEGLMDCLAFRSLTGIKNSTSIFGANITTHQKELLNEFKEVCYVYNNDTAGLKSVESLRDSYLGIFTTLKPAGDYDDVGEMAMNKFKGVDKWLTTEC